MISQPTISGRIVKQKLIQQDPKSLIHNSDLLNLMPFINTTILELTPSGNKIGFNLMDDGYFTIHYVTDTIPNLPADNKLPTQSK